MSKLFALATIVSACLLGGCKSDDGGHKGHQGTDMKMQKSSMSTTMSSADACPHCAGMQTTKADGTCPMCGMKMK